MDLNCFEWKDCPLGKRRPFVTFIGSAEARRLFTTCLVDLLEPFKLGFGDFRFSVCVDRRRGAASDTI